MKKVLFATTAAGALAIGGAASAQGVTVFGDGRLGLGFNVLQNGSIVDDGDADDDVRAISRVRFGVRMTGETPTGITFGGTIRADNAVGGAAGAAGNIFASGIYGTLTYGDIASAHQQHSGDLPEIGLTGLGFFNEIPYLGNRRHDAVFIPIEDGIEQDDLGVQVQSIRPIARYDFDFAGFGVSLSTDRELDDIGVGASFTGDFGLGAVTVGGGYYDDNINEQYSAGIGGGFAGFTGNVVYTNTRGGGLETIGAGLGTTFADIGFDAYYNRAIGGALAGLGSDGDDAYGLGMNFDLGGGASLRGGVVRTYQSTTAADLGIQLTF